MLTLKDAIKIVNEKEPRMKIVSGTEYENAFTFGLDLKMGGGLVNSSFFAVWKDGSRAEWVSIFDRFKLFGFDIINSFEAEDLKDI